VPAPPSLAYVFGYGSLVELREPLTLDGRSFAAVPGRLHGFRRRWGVAMHNWETGEGEKHFVDPRSGLKPRVAVAFLDIEEHPGGTVNGLAVPVDPVRLAELDRREVNYERIEVSGACRPAVAGTVFAYRGSEAARARGGADSGVCVSRQYMELIRAAFAALGPGELEEYERTTEPLRFPERDLELRYPESLAGD
jgi:hypothetical protein